MANPELTIYRNPIRYKNDFNVKTSFANSEPPQQCQKFTGYRSNFSKKELVISEDCETRITETGILFSTFKDICNREYCLFKDIDNNMCITDKRNASGRLYVDGVLLSDQILEITYFGEYNILIGSSTTTIEDCLNDSVCEFEYASNISIKSYGGEIYVLYDELPNDFNIYKLKNGVLIKISKVGNNLDVGSYLELFPNDGCFMITGQLSDNLGGGLHISEYYEDTEEWVGFNSTESITNKIVCGIQCDYKFQFFWETCGTPNKVGGFCIEFNEDSSENCIDMDCKCITDSDKELLECAEEFLG